MDKLLLLILSQQLLQYSNKKMLMLFKFYLTKNGDLFLLI